MGKDMIQSHFEKTGSEKAEKILNDWENELPSFWQVYPPSEAESSVVKEVEIVDQKSISKEAPDGKVCFLPVGSKIQSRPNVVLTKEHILLNIFCLHNAILLTAYIYS